MAKRSSDVISAQDLVSTLKSEVNAAFERLADRLTEGGVESESGESGEGKTRHQPGAMQLFKLDGKTQLVAQVDEDLPSGKYKVVVSIQSADPQDSSRCFADIPNPCCDSLNCTVLG